MDLEILRKELTEYVELTAKIRELSAVMIDEEAGEENYSSSLKKNYAEVGKIGLRTREIVEGTILPFLKSKEPATIEEILEFQHFCEMLLDSGSGEELDLSMFYEVSAKLLKEMECFDDDAMLIKQLHLHISICYANMNRTTRITVSREITGSYREDGLKAAARLMEYMQKDKYIKLDLPSKINVLREHRFYSALYDTFYWADDTNVKRFDALKESVEISYDPFYLENSGERYIWNHHRFRCIEHMGQLTERGNRWGFTRQQCEEICGLLDILKKMWDEEPRRLEMIPKVHLDLILFRNAYFAGRIGKKEYQSHLLELFDNNKNDKYDMYSVQVNLLLPTEYLMTLEKEDIDEGVKSRLDAIYRYIIKYVFHSVNRDAFNYLQEYLVAFLEAFIELDGVMTYEDMCVSCMAALHSPTYVHSRQVADISVVLTEWLLKNKPESVMDSFGCKDEEEVLQRQAEILNFVKHAALCHDFGKLVMIDSIFVYGRPLFDAEFDIIKQHPEMSAHMTAGHPSTAKYAECTRRHHSWYNHNGGYKSGLAADGSDLIANIIAVADCLDAATDSIGRSYRPAKSFAEVREEIINDCGTHFWSEFSNILMDDECAEKIKQCLNEGRERNYRKTYRLLMS